PLSMSTRRLPLQNSSLTSPGVGWTATRGAGTLCPPAYSTKMQPLETQSTRHTMQSGTMVFTQMNRVMFGQPAAAMIVAEADRLGAKRVFLLTGRTLNRDTDEVEKVRRALGSRFAGVHDHMPAHSPRDAVVACANAAREADTDLLVTVGGGSVTDGGKAVTICLEHCVVDVDGMEPFRTIVTDGKRRIPNFRAPKVRQIAVPTTLSAGEFNARAGITDTRLKLKKSFVPRAIVRKSVILDPAVTVHTPEWL